MEDRNTILVQTNQLSVGYKATGPPNKLFENLSLSLHKGKLVCFMGPNGIGKSTLIRTIAGLQSPMEGSISGVSVKNISVVLTDRVESNLSVFEFVSYGRYPYLSWHIQLSEEDFVIIDQCLEQVRISDLKDRKLYELSDGQIQMTAIARALAQSTPVLLLDEPTAHLDLNNRVEIMNLLRHLAHESGKAILVSTHELDLALQTSDWIWLATRQKTILAGMPEDLVLEGAFDDTFQFKGFDLKTGKVLHQPTKNKTVELLGEGAVYWWTKNALERNGYSVGTGSESNIKISCTENTWTINNGGNVVEVHSIRELIHTLE